jgi:hypothetical protein
MFAGCPIIWSSKLMTETCLSTTEAEYVSLSMALRETITLMQIMEESKQQGFIATDAIPRIHCKAFEDNSGALEIAKLPKMRPRTKHINIKFHHFREYVQNKLIQLFKISTEDQCADLFTKNLGKELFIKFRKTICGW